MKKSVKSVNGNNRERKAKPGLTKLLTDTSKNSKNQSVNTPENLSKIVIMQCFISLIIFCAFSENRENLKKRVNDRYMRHNVSKVSGRKTYKKTQKKLDALSLFVHILFTGPGGLVRKTKMKKVTLEQALHSGSCYNIDEGRDKMAATKAASK